MRPSGCRVREWAVDTSCDSPYTARYLGTGTFPDVEFSTVVVKIRAIYRPDPLDAHRDVHLGMGTFAVFALADA